MSKPPAPRSNRTLAWASACSTGGIRPFSPAAQVVRAPPCCLTTEAELPSSASAVHSMLHSTPPSTSSHPARFQEPSGQSAIRDDGARALVSHSEGRSEFRAKRPHIRCLNRPAECHSGTLQGATGGTRTHSRRTSSKLGRLRPARQELVRDPESNTKYGGNLKITGGRRATDRLKYQ